MSAPAGWFPDPSGRAACRWWDGSGWSRYLSDDPNAAAPVPAHAPTGPPTPTGPAATGPGAGASAYPPGYQRLTRAARAADRPTSKRNLLLTIVAAVVLLTVGSVIVVQQRSTELLFPTQAGSPSPPSGGLYDKESRQLTLPGLGLRMPGEPFTVSSGRDAMPPVLLGGRSATAVVETGSSAEIAVGEVAAAVAGADVEETADLVFDRAIRYRYTAKERPEVKKREAKTLSDNFPHPVRTVTAQVHFDRPDLKSRYDRISVLITPRPDGGFNGWISYRPSKMDEATQAAYQDTVESIIIE